MAKQTITVELDDETIDSLAALGKPADVLAQLACSATTEGVQRLAHGRRAQTDASLRVERDQADVAIALAGERVERRRDLRGFLAGERSATDKDLTDERKNDDTLAVDQREANSRMVRATIRAQELALEADVAKERAEKSETELRAVGELREMFVGILGHDLRNPLNSILMTATVLVARGQLDAEDAKHVARIISASHRMTRLIGQTLDLTHARLGGGLPIEVKPTDLREVCRSVVDEFDAAIQYEVEGDVTGTWDFDRLTEVLSNITGNALEYAAPGSVVSIRAHADGAAVVVEVSNRGAPIPAAVLPFIFEPFRRAQQHKKSATGNLGLGLYISHQIVISHGGTLDVHSANGTTTFVMRLPRRAA